MATDATTLASAIARKAVDLQTLSATITRLSARLTSDEGFTSAYAYDHADEELGWAVEAAEDLTRQLAALRAYTVVGERREQAKRLAGV